MQQEAVAAGLLGRDSLLVMPTGGGKSLCYQLPPLVAGRVDIVVSPLIALMEDQIASLRSVGVQAAAMHSGLSNKPTTKSLMAFGWPLVVALLRPSGWWIRAGSK